MVLESPSSTLALRNQLRLSQPGQLLLRRGRRPRLRPRGRGRRAARRSPTAPSSAWSARARRSTRSRRSGRAVAYEAPVTFLVLRNSEYAILKWFAAIEGVDGAPGLDLPALDCAASRPATGSTSRKVDGADELREALARGDRGRSEPRARRGPGRARHVALLEPKAERASRTRGRPARQHRTARPTWVAARHAGAAARRARRAARRGARAGPADRPRPLRLRREPVPALPQGGRDGPRRRRRRARSSPTRGGPARPSTFRAGGTSLNGQGQTDGILVDVRRHFRGVAVRATAAPARAVKPGTVLGHANRVLAPHGYKLGPDPASTDIASVGGVIANNSGGMRCGIDRRLLLDRRAS